MADGSTATAYTSPALAYGKMVVQLAAFEAEGLSGLNRSLDFPSRFRRGESLVVRDLLTFVLCSISAVSPRTY